MPIFVIISENDKLVDTDISYEFAGLLGAPQASFSFFDNDSVLEKERTCKDFPWVMVLPQGGHYSFKKVPRVVNDAISSFMAALKPSLELNQVD